MIKLVQYNNEVFLENKGIKVSIEREAGELYKYADKKMCLYKMLGVHMQQGKKIELDIESANNFNNLKCLYDTYLEAIK